MNDPIGDMLTRIRNAQMRGKSTTMTPASKMRARVLDALSAGQGPAPDDPHEQRIHALAVAVTRRDVEMG